MTVRAILDTKGHQVQSVEPDAKLSAAIKILSERRIGAVLVLSQGRIEGILSERDVVRVLGERGASVLDEPVSQVMTHKVVSCREKDTVSEIMETMTRGKFRHLPVVEDSKVVGLISIGSEGASVAWQAHIGGFVAGLILFALFDPVPRATRNAADASSRDA